MTSRSAGRGTIRAGSLIALGVCSGLLSACRTDEPLPPVFGAVFGLSGAAVTPFTLGKIPERQAGPGDRLVGAAAANPGSCIWQDEADRRFRAPCPEGTDGIERGS